jgi:hypothetical protein
MLNGLDLVTMASTIATGKYNGLLVVVLFVLIGVMLAGFEGMLIGGITGALVVALSGVFSSPLLTGLVTGLGIGVGFGMKFGGNAVMKHLALRHALRKSGVVPPGLERLLDEATDLVLLQRIGGGYQFIHQTIRDYFAKQYLLSKTSGGAKTK